MKAFLVATSAIALVATIPIAQAQNPKGEQGQKELSQPSSREGGAADKDTKARDKMDAPADKKAQQEKAPKEGARGAAKEGSKDATDKEKAARDAPKDGKKEAADKDKGGKEGKEAAGKDKGDGKGAKGSASLNKEQRTKVQSSFSKHKRKSANINISVNIGVAVPRTVELYAVPEEIVVIVPAYRRYRYFIVGDRVCIVDPDSYEIVEIIIIS